MSPRPTMQKLIALVRLLINDPAGASAKFSDDAIQEHLDFVRIYRNDVLSAQGNPVIGWQSDLKHWEDGVSLTDSSSQALAPATSDAMAGFWTFVTIPSTVYANGWVHDPYAAAAELLTLWAGTLEEEVRKFSADGSTYEFDSIKSAKLNLAAQYMAKSTTFGAVKSVRMVRDDLNA